jgi:hypothetical protein
MKFRRSRAAFVLSVLLLFFYLSSSAQAAPVFGYVGPGAGLSMLGALFAVMCVVFLALLGPILYPIRLFLTWRRKRLNAAKGMIPEG